MTVLNELESLINLLRDEDTRWDAILQLKMVQDPDWVEPLIAYLEDPEWVVRWCVAEKLGEFHDPRAIPSLISLLSDPDLHVRKNAVKAIIRFGKDAIGQVVPLFEELNPLIRRYALYILTKIGPEGFPLLKQIVAGSSWIVANRIVLSLWTIGGEDSIPFLIDLMSVSLVRKNAIVLLSQLKSEKAIEPMLMYYKHKGCHALVIRAIENMGIDVYGNILLRDVYHPDSNISKAAGSIILKIGEPFLPVLLTGLRSDGPVDKKRLLLLVAKIGPEPILPQLRLLLETNPPFASTLDELIQKHSS